MAVFPVTAANLHELVAGVLLRDDESAKWYGRASPATASPSA
jgi:hypothetical protein